METTQVKAAEMEEGRAGHKHDFGWGTSREGKTLWEVELQSGEKGWVYEEAGYGLECFVKRKPGKDVKDPGQPLVETKASRTKEIEKRHEHWLNKINKLRKQGQQKMTGTS